MIDIVKHFNFLENKNTIFSYSGKMNHSIINSLLKTIWKKLSKRDIEYSILKKIYRVMEEALENVNKHGIPKGLHRLSGNNIEIIFFLNYENDHLCITTGNYVENTIIPQLSEKFQRIVSLEKPSLKKLYMNTLRTSAEKIKTQGMKTDTGAGIGIMNIAITSDQNMSYYFNPINEKFSFFVIEVKVKLKS